MQGATGGGARTDAYNFDPDFERAVVALCCERPRFFGRVGAYLDPEALGSDAAKHAVLACKAIFAETGHGPEASLLVIQRLRRWMDDGKLTQEQVVAVGALLDEADYVGLPPEEATLKEVVPVVQMRLQTAAVRAAITDHARRGDLTKAAEMIARAKSLGDADASQGVDLGMGAFDEIARIRGLKRFPTGIAELDADLGGGLCRGDIGLVAGGPGAGKSIFLSGAAAEGAKAGMHVLLATLEVAVPHVLARMLAYLTGVETSDILSGEKEQEARFLVEGLVSGRCTVKDFTPDATSVDDIAEWVKESEQKAGKAVDMLVVDYLDRLSVPKMQENENDYHVGKKVTQALRILARDKQMFTWTASQSKGRDEHKKKRIDTGDLADSMHKARIADLVITIMANEEGDRRDVTLFVAKHRVGRSRFTVGPYPSDFEHGRLILGG